MLGRICNAGILVGTCLLLFAPAWATSRGTTSQGESFVIGGTADDERSAMRQDRKKFNLWVQTGASAGSAPPDIDVRISTRTGQTVLETRMNGPWLFVNLGLGEYFVAVSAAGITQQRGTIIHRGDHTEMVFFFDSPQASPGAPGGAGAPR
jgi:hypothetical protein